MTGQFVIMDTEPGKGCRLYTGGSNYIPWISHAFTDCLGNAQMYRTLEQAQKDCDVLTRTKFEFDGNTPLKPGRLKVMKIVLMPVEQGG